MDKEQSKVRKFLDNNTKKTKKKGIPRRPDEENQTKPTTYKDLADLFTYSIHNDQ